MSNQMDPDWALMQAVENARLLRRSEHRKMEAQVSTKCLMRADAKREREAIKNAKEEQMGGGAKEAASEKDVKPAAKRTINNKAAHKRDRALRRMYGDLTPEELEEMDNSNREKSSKKMKRKKKLNDSSSSSSEQVDGSSTPPNENAAISPDSGISASAAIAEKMEATKAADAAAKQQQQQQQQGEVAKEEMGYDLDESMGGLGSPMMDGGSGKKPFGVVFKPYAGDTFGTRGKYTEGMVYQSRLTRNNKKKKGLLSAFFNPGRPKIKTPREEDEEVASEISVDLSSKQRCAATLCNLSSIPSNIANLVNEGALDALIKLAHGDDTSVSHNCAVTLCNISADSNAAVRLVLGNGKELQGSPLDAILALSHSDSEAVRNVCLVTLFRLSQIPGLEATLVNGNVVPSLMRLRHDSDICALTMARTVFNLANVREVYLRIEKVIQAAVTIASSATTIEQLICAARTFKTMGNKIDLRARLLEEGVMAATVSMLNKATDPSINGSNDKLSDELTKLCCSVLHDLASCPRNRLAMVREKIVGIVVTLANVPKQRDVVRGICAGVISELAQSEGNQVQVINQGLGVLLKLADSKDERTRLMCAETLCELSRSRKGCPRVVKSGGIQLLTNLLKRDGENKTLRHKVAEALNNLMKPEWTAVEILKNAVPSVVGLILTTGRSTATDDRVARTAAIKILYGMSCEHFMCNTLEQCDAMEALLPLARTGATNVAVQMRCIAAVCNISRASTKSNSKKNSSHNKTSSPSTTRSSTERLAQAGAVGIFLGCVKQSVGDADGNNNGIPGRAVVDSVAALCKLAEDPSCAEQIVQQGLHSLIKLALYGTLPSDTATTNNNDERPINNEYWSSKAREWCSVILCLLSYNKKTRKSQVLKGVSKAIIGLASSLQVSSYSKKSGQAAQEDVAQRCAAALNNYSLNASSIARLVEDGVIEVLLKLATSYSEQCRENCARALCNICTGHGMETVVVDSTTAVPELMVMALVRSESAVTKQICAVALMNVLIPETIEKLIKYGIVWAMSSLSHQAELHNQLNDSGTAIPSNRNRSPSNVRERKMSIGSNGSIGSGGLMIESNRRTSSEDLIASLAVKDTSPKKILNGIKAATKFLSPVVQHSLVTACATAFLNLSCTELGRSRILDDAGALGAIFNFLLGGSGGFAGSGDEGVRLGSSDDGDYVNHCQKLSWNIIWNLLKDPLNHQTLVLHEFLRTVETLAVTARSDVEVFHIGGSKDQNKGNSLDMDDHILREIFNLIDTDSSNTLDKYELLDAVTNNQQVLELVHSAPILAPLLQPDAFENALMDLDTAHSGIVTFSEFKAFLITQTRKLARATDAAKKSHKNLLEKKHAAEQRRRKQQEEDDDDYYSDEDAFEAEENEEKDDGSPSVSTMMTVMNNQHRHKGVAGAEAAQRHTAKTLKNVAVAMRRLSCNDSICEQIVEKCGISIIVAACRSSELETKTMCAKVLATLAKHEATRKTVVAEGAMAALELISSVEDGTVQVLVATTLRLLSWYSPNAAIMTQQGFLTVARKICNLAESSIKPDTPSSPRTHIKLLRTAIYDVAATMETISWDATSMEVMAHTNGTSIIQSLLKYDMIGLCRPTIIALCNMASCAGVYQAMFDEGAIDIFVSVCSEILFNDDRPSSNHLTKDVISDLRHRITLMLAYLSAGLTNKRIRSSMVASGVVPYVLKLATMPSTALATKEVCASVLCALSHAPATRKLMIEQGALSVVTDLAECGSSSARLNCTTAMAKLSASVVNLEQGTVASLISLCMAPPPSHPGSPKGSPKNEGAAEKNNDDLDGVGSTLDDIVPIDPTVLPAPPKAMHFDHLINKRSKEMHEPQNSSDEEALPIITPVKWKKQSINVDGVAPDAPVSDAASVGSGSLEGEALAIEANLSPPTVCESDKEIEDEEDDLFDAQWFPKYNESDGSEREKMSRRASLVAVHFNDSDDEESVQPYTFDNDGLGTINEV